MKKDDNAVNTAEQSEAQAAPVVKEAPVQHKAKADTKPKAPKAESPVENTAEQKKDEQKPAVKAAQKPADKPAEAKPVSDAVKGEDDSSAVTSDAVDGTDANTDANSEEHGQKREGRGRSRRSPRHVRAAGQRRKKESQQVDDSDTQAKQPGELSPQQPEAEVEATAKTDAPVVEETQAKEPGQLAPAEEQPVSKQEKAKLDVEAVQDELQFDAEPLAGKEPSADAEPSANDKPSKAVDSTDEVTSADDNATTEVKPAKEAQTSVQESNVEKAAPAAQTEPAVEAKTTQADTAPEAKDEATASPEQVEINLADAPVVAEPEAQLQEAKADTPAAKEKAETTAAPSSSLAASGKGKRGASHPMALPAAVNDAFVDVALTAKADDTRPALAVSGKTAAMSHVTSRASAVTTLPQSVDDVAEVAAVAE